VFASLQGKSKTTTSDGYIVVFDEMRARANASRRVNFGTLYLIA
jgi:hypothetical protein